MYSLCIKTTLVFLFSFCMCDLIAQPLSCDDLEPIQGRCVFLFSKLLDSIGSKSKDVGRTVILGRSIDSQAIRCLSSGYFSINVNGREGQDFGALLIDIGNKKIKGLVFNRTIQDESGDDVHEYYGMGEREFIPCEKVLKEYREDSKKNDQFYLVKFIQGENMEVGIEGKETVKGVTKSETDALVFSVIVP